MLVANIKIWKSHLNIREGSDYLDPRNKLYDYNKDNCITIIMHVGGIDNGSGTDLDTDCDKNTQQNF